MDTATFLHYSIAFGIGGLWIMLSSIIADKFGSKVGGFVSAFPAPAAIAYFFIAYGQSVDAAVQATVSFPVAYSLVGILLLTYALLARRGIVAAMGTAVALWLVVTLLFVQVKPDRFIVSLLLYATIFICAYSLMHRHIAVAAVTTRPVTFTLPQLFGRAIFGGSVVLTAVVMSHVAGPLYGGVFAAFPAAFVSTLIIMHLSGGPAMTQQMIRTMYVTGTIVVVGYVTAVRFVYPALGVWLGTLIALLVAVMLAYLTHAFVLPRLKL